MLVGCGKKRSGDIRLKKKSVSFLVEKLNQNEFAPDWFSAKARLKLKEPNSSLKGNLNIRLEKDKKIWVSISPAIGVNIEVARALITPDSIKVLDKFHKIYYAEEFDYIQKFVNYPLDFQALQTLILGGSIADVEFENADARYGYYNINTVDCSLFLNPADYTLYQMHLNDPAFDQSLVAVFTEYEQIENLPFSHQRSMDIKSGDADIEIDMSFSKVKVNKELTMPFKISKKYRRERL